MKGYKKIKEELGNPPAFYIPPNDFTGGKRMSRRSIMGWSYPAFYVFTILTSLRGIERDNTIYHEIAHILWPWRPHWWIECFAEKMAGGGGRGDWSKRHKKTPDMLPSRTRLIEMARRQSARLRKRYG